VLSFAAIHRELQDVAVGAAERLVPMQHGLYEVVARGHVVQVADREAGCAGVERDRLARLHRLHVHAEHHLRARRVVDLHARLGGRIRRQQQQQPAVDRRLAATGRDRD
jgi:hypothetical protein